MGRRQGDGVYSLDMWVTLEKYELVCIADFIGTFWSTRHGGAYAAPVGLW